MLLGIPIEEIVLACPSLRKPEREVPPIDEYGDELSRSLKNCMNNLISVVIFALYSRILF
jgi:hypothetical protein